MTRKEMFDLRIASDGFRGEGRLAEALYFSERMMEKTYKDLETEEKTNVG